MDIKVLLSNVKHFVNANSPTILTTIGVAGVIGTAIAVYYGANEAVQILDEERMLRKDRWVEQTGEDGASYPEELTTGEIIKYTWKCYIPAVAVGLVTVSAIVGSNHISLRRQAALASLYTIAEKAAKRYEEKVVETLGEKKAHQIKEEVVKDKVKDIPLSQSTVVHTGRGTTLMFDTMSGRYFYSELEHVRKIVNDFNRDILSHGYKSLNEFYDELDLAHVKMGDLMGWGSDFGFIEVDYVPMLADNDQPCIALDYKVEPEPR